MIKELGKFKSLNEFKSKLKNKGGLKKVVKKIREELHLEENTFTSYVGLYKWYQSLNENNLENKKDEDEFFKSLSAKYIYALINLDTDKRAEILDIKEENYLDKKLAKKWRNRIIKEIHPDKCSHKRSDEAVRELEKLYRSMIEDEK